MLGCYVANEEDSMDLMHPFYTTWHFRWVLDPDNKRYCVNLTKHEQKFRTIRNLPLFLRFHPN